MIRCLSNTFPDLACTESRHRTVVNNRLGAVATEDFLANSFQWFMVGPQHNSSAIPQTGGVALHQILGPITASIRHWLPILHQYKSYPTARGISLTFHRLSGTEIFQDLGTDVTAHFTL